MAYQDEFYLAEESNAFFDRWQVSDSKEVLKIRESKKEILDQLLENIDPVESLRVLEIGCFIGDLLGVLQNDYKCQVHGVESSSKACRYAKENFRVEVEHSTFVASSLFRLSKENHAKFDLIICDDVLSWMSREIILPTLGVFDWMLRAGGHIYFRDFCPSQAFCFKNHHWPDQEIYNFKQAGGHKSFLLNSGNYLENYSYIRTSNDYQKIETKRPDAMTWSDSILTKLENPLHPLADL